jgi:hypothetical protein
VLPPGDGQQNEVGKTADSGSDEVLATTGKTVGGDGSRSKEIVPGRKSMVEDAGDAANAATSQTSPAKPEGDNGTPVVNGASGEKDGDGRTTSPAVAATVAHVGPGSAGNNGTASEIAPGVAIGHTSADIAGGKVQAGEAVAHAANSQAGLGEQGGATGATEIGGTHRILTATPTTLEVGVSNGTQGWLKIRAEMSESGQVNASLSSATSAGQEMLHRELPALTAYLHQERVPVNGVTVQANAAAGTGSMPAGGMNPEGRGQQREREGGGEQRQGVTNVDSDRVDGGRAYEGLNGPGQDGLLSPGIFPGGGGYLNVRA